MRDNNSGYSAIFDLEGEAFLSTLRKECCYWATLESHSHQKEINALNRKIEKKTESPVGYYFAVAALLFFAAWLSFGAFSLSSDFSLTESQYNDTGVLSFRDLPVSEDGRLLASAMSAMSVNEQLCVVALEPFSEAVLAPMLFADMPVDSVEGQLLIGKSLFPASIVLFVPAAIVIAFVVARKPRLERQVDKISESIQKLQNDTSQYIDPLHPNVVPLEFRRADILCALLLIAQRGEAHNWKDVLAVYKENVRNEEWRRRANIYKEEIKQAIRDNRPIVNVHYY